MIGDVERSGPGALTGLISQSASHPIPGHRCRHNVGMTPTLLEAITKQIAAEFAASFSYLAMAGWCEHHAKAPSS